MEKLVEVGIIEIEEIEIDIKIKIRKGKVSIVGIRESVINEILEEIQKRHSLPKNFHQNLSLPEEYERRALIPGNYTEDEIINLIRKYIENAILHINKANDIIKNLNKEET